MPRPIDHMKERLVGWYGASARVAHLENAQHFNIENVARYSKEFGGKAMDEIEFAVPPWDFVYAESDEMIYVVETRRTADDFNAWEITMHIAAKDNHELNWRGTISMGRDGSVHESAKWETYFCAVWVEAAHYDKPAREIHAQLNALMDKAKGIIDRRLAVDPHDSYALEMNRKYITEKTLYGGPLEETPDDVRVRHGKTIPDEYALVFFLATMLANCKNVPTVATEVPPKLVRAQGKRDRVPVHRWYRLMIDPMRKTIARVAGDGGGTGELTYERAFHICRGHFKTFKESRPLFGRVTGRFWWPMHARGNKDLGTVEKDYALR